MNVTRITAVKGYGGTILGRDLDGVLEEGMVYGLIKVEGVIVARPLGKTREIPGDDARHLNEIAVHGGHLLTEAEADALGTEPIIFE